MRAWAWQALLDLLVLQLESWLYLVVPLDWQLATQIAVAGGAYLLMTKHTQDATSAFEEQGLALSELREKYKSFTAAQLAIKGIEASEEVENKPKN